MATKKKKTKKLTVKKTRVAALSGTAGGKTLPTALESLGHVSDDCHPTSAASLGSGKGGGGGFDLSKSLKISSIVSGSATAISGVATGIWASVKADQSNNG
jgi:hypothetical protein